MSDIVTTINVMPCRVQREMRSRGPCALRPFSIARHFFSAHRHTPLARSRLRLKRLALSVGRPSKTSPDFSPSQSQPTSCTTANMPSGQGGTSPPTRAHSRTHQSSRAQQLTRRSRYQPHPQQEAQVGEEGARRGRPRLPGKAASRCVATPLTTFYDLQNRRAIGSARRVGLTNPQTRRLARSSPRRLVERAL